MFNVTFVSNSTKKVIKRVNSVLDRYAIRIADNTWNTEITQEGLKVIYDTLKNIATKQTSVSCYRKTQGRMNILWSIGKVIQRENNAIYVHKHKKKIKTFYPNYIRLGSICLRIAGLFHDVGKINKQFQLKLSSNIPKADDVRHELISYFLFKEYCTDNHISFDSAWNNAKIKIEKFINGDNFLDFNLITNWKDLVGFLILTHHRLPHSIKNKEQKFSTKNSLNLITYYKTELKSLNKESLEYDKQTFKQIEKNIKEALLLMNRNIIKNSSTIEDLNFWFATSILSRACLIFSDHEQSSIKIKSDRELNNEDLIRENKINKDLHANTILNSLNKRKYYNQKLDWHLKKVADRAFQIITQIYSMNLPYLSERTIENLLKPTNIEKFFWQNEVVSHFSKIKEQSLIFNIAGTGSGKTRGNVLALAALNKSQDKKFRFSTALNLRSLTLQTIDSYKNQLNLSDEEILGIIGDDNISKLFNDNQKQNDDDEEQDENYFTDYKISLNDNINIPDFLDIFLGLSIKQGNEIIKIRKSNKKAKILSSPVLVSTIDFLNDAGDLRKQGNHSLSLLRIMHNDLILDEIDSYEPEALTAICRIIMLSAMFGNNIIVSSATLSKDCALIIKEAFKKGCLLKKSLHSSLKDKLNDNINESIFFISNTEKTVKYNSDKDFENEYLQYIDLMLDKNKKITKKAMILNSEKNRTDLYNSIVNDIQEKHNIFKHSFENKNISFGLIRIANIRNVVNLTEYLSKHPQLSNKIQICCYHSQHTLLQRQYIEERLEFLLNRKGEIPNFKKDKEFKEEIKNIESNEIIFVVVASPVAEIGRDFDFDWGICEPSSSQSLVQTAGRINRHREIEVNESNFSILEYNFNSFNNKCNLIFNKPGLDFNIFNDKERRNINYSIKIKKENKTESMKDLLIESEINNKFDASFKFKRNSQGKEIHFFSALDNLFLNKRLENAKNIFCNDSFHYHFFNSDFYNAFQLRDHNGQTEYYINMENLKGITINYYFKRELQQQPNNKNIIIEEKLTNSWLIVPEKYIKDKINKLSISNFDAYSIRINSYDIFSQPIYYSPSLGLYKKLTNCST